MSFRYLSEIGIVRLVLLGHEEEEDPVEELKTVQGGDTHVQEHAVQHRHRNLKDDDIYMYSLVFEKKITKSAGSRRLSGLKMR
jgi:hypothetical protein